MNIFLIIFLLLIPGMVFSAFGTVDDYTTDKSLYHFGDKLIISGMVSYDPDVEFASIQIFTPGKSSFADFYTIPVNPDGEFSVTFNVGGPTWPFDGIYPIIVTYDGNLEKSIKYVKSELIPESEITPKDKPETKPEDKPVPQTKPALETKLETKPVPQTNISENLGDVIVFNTLKLTVPNFPAFDKSPQYYIDRYTDEPNYQSWFDLQFPNYSITDIVGYKSTPVDNFPAFDKSPQYYIDRYTDEPNYQSWFDLQFPDKSIYNILGYEDPVSVPSWIRDNAELWATGKISDSVFVSGIEFMLENNIIIVSATFSGDISDDEIPKWIRNNAHWWSQDLISDDEFINSLEYLIQKGIITI